MATVISRTSPKQSIRRGKPIPENSAHAEEPMRSANDLHGLLAAQQAQMTAQQEQIAMLTAQHTQMMEQQRRMATLIQQLTQPMEPTVELVETSVATVRDEHMADEAPSTHKATSRRGLLKWGGLGAAAALAAAGAAGLGHAPAQAANGDALILGESNTSSSNTTLSTTAATGLILSSQNEGSFALYAGVPASSTAITCNCGADSFGVVCNCGTDGTGAAAYTSGISGVGLLGFCTAGYGVIGQTSTGIDLMAFGTGRILQQLSGFTGAPTSGSYTIGEQIRDNAGDLYICVMGGSPGTWRRVAAGTPGHSGSFNFLPEPIRLLDTRAHSPWASGSQHTLQVTGVVVDGISVPASAIGVVGNVTVVGPTSGGDLRLYPGPAVPPTSSINFIAGQNIANGVTVRFNSSGQIVIKVDMGSGAQTNVLFDAVGYIL